MVAAVGLEVWRLDSVKAMAIHKQDVLFTSSCTSLPMATAWLRAIEAGVGWVIAQVRAGRGARGCDGAPRWCRWVNIRVATARRLYLYPPAVSARRIRPPCPPAVASAETHPMTPTVPSGALRCPQVLPGGDVHSLLYTLLLLLPLALITRQHSLSCTSSSIINMGSGFH